MKNLARNSVSIFLYKFVINSNRIEFVLNEAIAEDMYPEVDEQIKPLIHACSETLLRYRHFCSGDTIMDGNLLDDGCIEVMLEKGMGKHFDEIEKQNLFDDANQIAQKLMEVVARRSEEMNNGIYPGPQNIDQMESISRENIKRGLQDLGEEKRKPIDYASIRPGLKQIRPEDLPSGVVATMGYDHRGSCIVFEHHEYGDLGRIVLMNRTIDTTMIQAEFCEDIMPTQSLSEKRSIFSEVVEVINEGVRKV